MRFFKRSTYSKVWNLLQPKSKFKIGQKVRVFKYDRDWIDWADPNKDQLMGVKILDIDLDYPDEGEVAYLLGGKDEDGEEDEIWFPECVLVKATDTRPIIRFRPR